MPDSVFRIALDGWRLGLLSIVTMPLLSSTAYLCIVVCEVVVSFLKPSLGPGADPRGGLLLFTVVRQTLIAAIFASILIAVHRIILLSEVADRPIWRIPPNYRSFAGWLLFLNLLWLAPTFLDFWLLPHVARPDAEHSAPGVGAAVLVSTITVLFEVIAVVASLRLMLLLPALALATPSAEWRNAWYDSRGHAWKFLRAQALAGVPVLLIAGFALWYRGLRPPEGGWFLFSALVTLLMCYVGGAVASRLFWLYGATLTGRGNPAAVPQLK
jgi:hypothetical protein